MGDCFKMSDPIIMYTAGGLVILILIVVGLTGEMWIALPMFLIMLFVVIRLIQSKGYEIEEKEILNERRKQKWKKKHNKN